MYLMEINSHSLFSKWFSESGKLVLKLFQQLHEYLEDPQTFVFILIDEVESLTAARQASLSGSEPSDAIRVVNAILTQIDGLKRFPNAMLMTTTNLIEAIGNIIDHYATSAAIEVISIFVFQLCHLCHLYFYLFFYFRSRIRGSCRY